MPVVRPTPPDLVDRLSAFNSLSGVPRSEIQWLVASGELRHFARGEIILRKGDETRQMVIVLTGRIVVTFEQGTGHRHAIENTAGSMTGLLPYSRLARALGDVVSEEETVSANSAALNQVWSNLLENALDAAPRSGAVVVDAARQDGAVVVRVIDDGPGIPPDVRPRMFDPFFTTKKVGEGVGLGLDIARRVVRTLEGQIDVDTRPGRTEFRVSLPLGPS
jgi:signal transduction histidine kinase